MKRILLVDPQPLSRRGLAQILDDEPDLEVCGQAADGEEALALFEATHPDLVIAEVRSPKMNGLDLTHQLLVRQPGLLILLFSRRQEAVCAERALRAGARAYLCKTEEGSVVAHAVRHVLEGGYYVSQCVMDELLCAVSNSLHPVLPSPSDVLSERELEMFEYIGEGLSTHEIADRMQVSIKTIESYRNRAKEKLNLKSTTDLMRQAVHWLDEDRVCYSWSGCAGLNTGENG